MKKKPLVPITRGTKRFSQNQIHGSIFAASLAGFFVGFLVTLAWLYTMFSAIRWDAIEKCMGK